MAVEKYYVGPKLLGDIRDTITRVAGMPNATRRVEQPVRLQDMPRPGEGGGKVFRIATFTGAWSKNATKTVPFKFQTTTPNTVTVTNLFANITGSTVTSTNFNCAIAKEGTAWFLIAAECD